MQFESLKEAAARDKQLRLAVFTRCMLAPMNSRCILPGLIPMHDQAPVGERRRMAVPSKTMATAHQVVALRPIF
jgi:hypothetical protein